ncbi:MAG: hypothetical protein BGN88_06515 [Clostridiales bacterium 43-6]|nr:MAG: hypothetical protein BGN88_06515 [Clostridiales bacterium 43-6]
MNNDFNEKDSYNEPQVNSYTPVTFQQPSYEKYNEPVTQPGTKGKTKYGIGSLIACCLICSVLSGTVTSGVFLYTSGSLGTLFGSGTTTSNSTAQKTGQTVNINVDKTAVGLVEAVAEKVSPSVVGIRATTSYDNFFFGEQQQSGEGSGIIYKSDGYIITNYHVISTAVENQKSKLEVFLPSDAKTAIAATVVGYEMESDIAVIKIEKTGLQAIEIGDSSKLKVGETAVAVGNPGGLEFMGSVSTGIISGLNRKIQMETSGDMTLIQTDAAINPGNSGGALVNSEGKLIGVNSAKMAADNFEGMGFAIPVNSVVSICNRILTNKDEKKAFLGVKISTTYTSERLKSMGYPSGVVIEQVEN